MATITASILIGESHQNQGGIIPSYQIFLSESDRAALILSELNIDCKPNFETITWIPTIENMLEDILLMINIYVFKNETICNEFSKLLENKKLNNIELLEEIGKAKLKKLYKLNKDLLEKNASFKIIISAFDDSTIEEQLQKLKEYNMELEICKSSYNRYFSVWENRIKIIGKL